MISVTQCVPGGGVRVLSQGDLLTLSDFRLAGLDISPARRSVTSGDDCITLEPRMMQVLVLLARDPGQLVSRQTLFDQVWAVPVGDDSLNRAVAGVRKALALDPRIELETVPRAGYRLAIAESEPVGGADGQKFTTTSRRRFVASAIGLSVAAGGWALFRSPRERDPRIGAAIERVRHLYRAQRPGTEAQVIALLEPLISVAPDDAELLGWLALANSDRVENGNQATVAASVSACQRYAKRALAIDTSEGNALAALATLRPDFGDWFDAERRYRAVLERAPRNMAALNALVLLLQSVGRCRDSVEANQMMLSVDPINAVAMFRQGYKHWIMGNVPAADQAVDRAMALYPDHPAVLNARTNLFAFTGRPTLAWKLVENRLEGRSARIDPLSGEMWRVTLRAMESGSTADIARVREFYRKHVPDKPNLAYAGVMNFVALGQIDDSFDCARGYYLREGPLAGPSVAPDPRFAINDMMWRYTMILFLPITAAFRADARFADLCRRIGLEDYWQRSGVRPNELPSDRQFRLSKA